MSQARYVRRFSRTERAVHWIHASAFLVLLGSGLDPLPPVARGRGRSPAARKGRPSPDGARVGRRSACGVLVGDRRGLRTTARELDVFDADDRRWLLGRRSPQGRFNAGQKLNAALTAAFALLLAVSGVLLWLGERDTRFRFDSTIVLHDVVAWSPWRSLPATCTWPSFISTTRHALRGITLGTVRRGVGSGASLRSGPTDAQ